MFKKLTLLLSWYIAWSVISSLYSNKKGKDLKRTLSKAKQDWKNEKKLLLDNVIETQRNFIKDLENIFFTEENKEYLNTKKEELKKIVENYKKEWEELLKTLQKWWKDKQKKIKEQLTKLYNEKTDIINNLKWISPKTIKQFKQILIDYLEKLKKKIKNKNS